MHTHDHGHEHHHDHGDIPPAERTRALLAYMIDHNEHHAEELAELVDTLDGAELGEGCGEGVRDLGDGA